METFIKLPKRISCSNVSPLGVVPKLTKIVDFVLLDLQKSTEIVENGT